MASIQLYNHDGTYIQDIPANKIIWETIGFSNVLGGGQFWLKISLNYKYSEIDLSWKFIKLYEWSNLLYFWIIQNIKYNFLSKITVNVIWIFDLLNRVDLHTLTTYQGTSIRLLLESIKAYYPLWEFTKDIELWRLDTLNTSDRSYSWGELIRAYVSDSWFDFYLWADLKCVFKEVMSTTIHTLTIWKEINIDSSFYSEDISKLITDIVYTSTSNASVRMQKINEDSEVRYWKIERDNYYNSTSTTTLWQQVQKDYQNLSYKKINAEILIYKSEYNIFNIQVWDKVTILWTDIDITEVKILKIDFTLTTAKLTLDVYNNIVKNLK